MRTRLEFERLAKVLADPETFEAGDAVASFAFRHIVVAQVLLCDLGSLRRVRERIGSESLAEALSFVQRGDLLSVVWALDPQASMPKNVPTAALADRIVALAEGASPAHPPVDPVRLDLKGLRALRSERGDGFVGWLCGLRDAELRALARRLDPHLPGVAKIQGPDALSRLVALSEGSEAVPALSLTETDAKGLRAARLRMGEHTFVLWASMQGAGAVRAFVRRAGGARGKALDPALPPAAALAALSGDGTVGEGVPDGDRAGGGKRKGRGKRQPPKKGTAPKKGAASKKRPAPGKSARESQR